MPWETMPNSLLHHRDHHYHQIVNNLVVHIKNQLRTSVDNQLQYLTKEQEEKACDNEKKEGERRENRKEERGKNKKRERICQLLSYVIKLWIICFGSKANFKHLLTINLKTKRKICDDRNAE
jgi:hypothetical protein